MQTSYDADLAERTHFYYATARRKFKVPVRSVVVLLRKEADGPAMSGRVVDDSLTFRFDVVRVWQIPPERLLQGPISLVPLAAISQVTEQTISDVIREMRHRIDTEASAQDAKVIWSTTLILLGLHYQPEFARTLLAGVMDMKESSTYQSILAEGLTEGRAQGRAEGLTEGERRVLLMMGSKRFGEPDARIKQMIADITSARRLEELSLRLFDVKSWNELLNA
jgi:predicted transposase YdaD